MTAPLGPLLPAGRGLAVLLAPGREEAQDAARRELSRQEYAEAAPPALVRAVGRVLSWLAHLLDGAAGGLGSPAARVVLVALLLGLAALVVVRLGPLQPDRSRRGTVFDAGAAQDARRHREAAEAAAAQGRWAQAVRERLRAVVREMEERRVLDPRPGRTADEVARDGGTALPDLATDLLRAAEVFDAVWYGGRPAGPESYATVAAVDDRVRALGAR